MLLDDEAISKGARLPQETFMQLIDTVKQGTGRVNDANKRSMFTFMDRDRSGTITRKVNGVTGFFFWPTLARCCCAQSIFLWNTIDPTSLFSFNVFHTATTYIALI